MPKIISQSMGVKKRLEYIPRSNSINTRPARFAQQNFQRDQERESFIRSRNIEPTYSYPLGRYVFLFSWISRFAVRSFRLSLP